MADFDALDPLFDAFPPVSTADWEATIRDDLRGKDRDRMLVWDSLEGITAEPYYRRSDLNDVAHVDPDADTPPLAGAETTPANAWRTRQDLSAPDLRHANRLAHKALDGGATDLGVVTDVRGGTVRGVPIQRTGDLHALLDGIPLAETPLHLARGPASVVLFAMLLTLAAERGVSDDALQGSVGFDPVSAVARGAMTQSGDAFALAADLVRAHKKTPGVRTLTVSATPYHDAGGSLVQELGCTLGALSETLAQLTERGRSVQAVTNALQFVVPVSTSYFLEMAKLRALRLLAPQVIAPFAEAMGAPVDLAPTDLFVQARCSRRTQTLYDPYTNLLRGTTEGMAAAIGGCDVLSVPPFDARVGPPSAFSSRIARNTSLILSEESHLDHVPDPAAGSYYVEALTDQVAQKAWQAFQDLEARGGLLASLHDGHVQSRIAEARASRTDRIATRRNVLVGTNHYPDTEETKRDDLDEAAKGVPLEHTQTLAAAPTSIDAIRSALRDGATVGDALAAWRDGDAAIEPLPSIRLSTPFDELRLRTEQAAADGPRPVVTLVPMGSASWRSARATFSRNVFGVAGFAVREPLKFDAIDAAVQAIREHDAAIAVLCSSDDAYPDLAPRLRDALDDVGSDALLVVAGNPEQIDGDLPVDAFVHKQSPLLQTLKDLQERLGIR
jgi:methylmalonyl-CoA mutase